MPIFTCLICSATFSNQTGLTNHALQCASRFAQHQLQQQNDNQPIVQDVEMDDFEGLSMSESSMETDSSDTASQVSNNSRGKLCIS